MDPTGKKKILIVEDNVAFCKILRIRLEASGYDVSTAFDGLEALSMARRMRPDLILLDLMLPKMDGQKVCRLIKFDRSFREVPVVILTSRDLDEEAESAKQNGADAFLVKTVHPEIMLDVIERLLERASDSVETAKV